MTTIDAARVLADLHRLRDFGRYKTGVHRPTYTADDMAARHWFAGRMAEAGLAPEMDGIGNILGTLAGSGPRLLAGSHLESQNYAGWLDGPLGCIYALEAARAINADPRFGGAGVEVGVWADEEGHFGSLMGSRSFCGEVADAEIDAARNRTDGTAMRAALERAGLAGKSRLACPPGRHRAYLEAHIEQGDTLESDGLALGVVTSIVGIWQFVVRFTGAQNHAGTTRMAVRRDAGLAAARFAVAIDERFPTAAAARTVWTIGRITLDPGAPSIIPGSAEMLLQIRDSDAAVAARLEALLDEMAAEATRRGPCPVTIERIRVGDPAFMDARVQDAFAAAAEQHAPGRHCRMPSGAGHDAQILAHLMPAGMLFVPSIGGISHHWSEDTSEADIVLGARVFADACARLLAA